MTTKVSLGQFFASLKATRDQLSDREAFGARSQSKYDAPSVAGLPMVGLGGSCGNRFVDVRVTSTNHSGIINLGC